MVLPIQKYSAVSELAIFLHSTRQQQKNIFVNMFQRSAVQLLAPAIRNAVQRRCQSVVSSPPTQKISFGEKLILGGGMCCASLVIPAWVLLHIKEYRGLK